MTSVASPYEVGLDKNAANHVPLSPISFLRQAAAVFPDRTAVIHGEVRRSYAEFAGRCRRLASALARRGVGRSDTVAILAPNIPAMLECHYAVPGIGAVLNPLNIRLDAESIAFILQHGDARVLLADREFAPVVRKALERLQRKPLLVEIDDGMGESFGGLDYEEFLREGDPDFDLSLPRDEWDAFILSYTSGTTGDPKGVVYHHRGAYLNSMANVAAWAMPRHPVMLWTLPMFHSLGWCFPWTVTLMGGTHVCLRKVEAKSIFDLIAKHEVTHMCGAPIVLNTLVNASSDEVTVFPQTVRVMTAASAPPPSVIERIEARGFDVLHVYGMTEVFGPSVISVWKDEWNGLPPERRAALKARQGVAYPSVEGLDVVDVETGRPVPRDGRAIGEVVKRSNTVMRGYLKNAAATAAAFAGGWFHSGDLAVMHPDGYIELKDRAKDIIISGGENISTIEVEAVLFRHPAVLEAAVVARPHDKWGETPCAFVTAKPGAVVTQAELIAFCRDQLAHFKCPSSVIFGPLPKTSTGKIQKFLLRQRAVEAVP
jgi:fatty-acyl-CoA synthase